MGMTDMNILRERLCVSQCCLNTGVTEEPLNLFQRHPALEGQGSGSMTENMRGDMTTDIAAGQYFCNLILYCLDLQAAMRGPAADKERGIIVLPTLEILCEVQFCSRVEVGDSFLTALAEHNTLSFLKVDVVAIEPYKLADSHSSRRQQVDDSEVA